MSQLSMTSVCGVTVLWVGNPDMALLKAPGRGSLTSSGQDGGSWHHARPQRFCIRAACGDLPQGQQRRPAVRHSWLLVTDYQKGHPLASAVSGLWKRAVRLTLSGRSLHKAGGCAGKWRRSAVITEAAHCNPHAFFQMDFTHIYILYEMY